MAIIGFHASHELYAPSTLLRYIRRAEQAGFQAVMCSDHFHPWSPCGESGFSFAWLGAALRATTLPFGTVCCPSFRYPPAVVAQAAASLGEMFPDRFWLALDSGQTMNEHILGAGWPARPERQARVLEAAESIRALWDGATVSRQGRLGREAAQIDSRPEHLPLLFGTALTPETARWVGTWADGLLTVAAEHRMLRRIVEAFRERGGEGKPMYLQAAVGYAQEADRAWHLGWERRPVAAWEQNENQNQRLPEQFLRAVMERGRQALHGTLRVSTDLGQHRAWIENDLDLGFDTLFLHNISGDQERFIDVFGTEILPDFTGVPL